MADRPAHCRAAAELARQRVTVADRLVKKGVITASEASQLRRWFSALADDLEAGMHLPE